jgi:hypothetical protein
VLKIADFGVAKMTHEEASEITRVGTNVFAPPEHHPDVRPDDLNEKLTPSADVYSLAKTIYTAMTGRAPRQFSRQPITELPEELASESWSGPLLAVLAKATAARVADRYQSVGEFWEGLASVQLAGGVNQELDDEATIVRSRLKAISTVERAAPRPDFGTLANAPLEIARPRKARIVVDLPGHGDRRVSIEQEQGRGPGERADSDGRASETRALGSSNAAEFGSGVPRGRPFSPDGGVTVATDANGAALRQRKVNIATIVHTGPGFLDRVRALIRSEWLPRVFIIFLAAALIGLAASTYYHFADQKPGLPFFGGQTKDGRIANADNVNLRTEPSGSVLATLPAGTRVRIVEQRGGWLKIKVLEWSGSPPDNALDSGWVDGRFVRMD